jgi:protein-S-isoprenylcysteine O-methyltransferase Ste14
MLLRAILAFLAMPAVVAIAVPLAIGMRELNAGGRFNDHLLLPLIMGFTILARCTYDFYQTGKGTLAPWSPPRHLVTVGMYRYSRNPMYVGVLMMLGGWAACFWSPVLATYAIFMLVGFHLRIVLGEEPWLARTHGKQWDEYKSRVPRWLI